MQSLEAAQQSERVQTQTSEELLASVRKEETSLKQQLTELKQQLQLKVVLLQI